MLVTVSGLVGSGKTTVARHLVHVLKSKQDTVALWNFRALPCFHPFGRPSRHDNPRTGRGVRGAGYRPRTLTAWTTLGYTVRIVAFRIYLLRHRAITHKVTNRYFYDNLAHFKLEGTLERRYLSLLTRLIPKPDVAILAIVSMDVAATRRPSYSAEYIHSLHASYSLLTNRFPNLIVVSTDPGQRSIERTADIVREALGG